MMSPSRVPGARAATRDLREAKSTLEKLGEFLETEGMRSKTGPRAFEDFERELHARMMEAERDIVAGEMARHDVDADEAVIDRRESSSPRADAVADVHDVHGRGGRRANALQGQKGR